MELTKLIGVLAFCLIVGLVILRLETQSDTIDVLIDTNGLLIDRIDRLEGRQSLIECPS